MRAPLRVSRKDLACTLWVPLYVLNYFLLERRPADGVWLTQLPADALLPFRAEFVVFYCAWFPFLIGTGVCLLLHRPAACRRYMAFLAATFFSSQLIWLLVPNGQSLRPAALPRDSGFAALVALLYRADTPTNVFPSVHVVGSLGAALAVRDGWPERPCVKRGAAVLAVLICLSTLLIKQHTLLDVLSGLLLSALAAGLIYRRSPAVSRPVLRRRAS